MKKFEDFNTGETWTLEEIREQFESFRDEMNYSSFEDYTKQMIQLGKNREGGYIEIKGDVEQ